MRDPFDPNEIQAWIAAHRDALPRTLGELGTFPVPYRGAIVRALPPPAREAIWREHFGEFLAPGSPLSPAQQAFVREAMAELPVLMADDLAAARARGGALEARMAPLFSREEAARVFGMVGPPEPPGGLPAPPR
ncbi:hypothetical protein J421_5388 (plasmid) [Gemmatirosa kalamazoonensis]|uniref:Uncharacterized protein n=1 Tax=Gemmatirosa kalamazoonensis TaxID=861299 RepID=W0RTK9_9BACT|nr:hypothetical protein [Gemmatirosa kalamazoonensis]AHG92923.1 hypothetical protein J421_5388 [Gemmatirosa kalamazoonensis]